MFPPVPGEDRLYVHFWSQHHLVAAASLMVFGGEGGCWPPTEPCKSLCAVFFPCPVLQVLLPSSHASSWVWRLGEIRDWIQHLQGRWSSPKLLHYSLTAGVDYHGDGEIPSAERFWELLKMLWRFCSVSSAPFSISALSCSFALPG